MKDEAYITKNKTDSLDEHDDKRTKEILTFLNNKYDESFEIIGKIGQARGLPGDLWGVRRITDYNGLENVRLENEAFTVTGNITTKGYVIKDSYYRIFIYPEYYKYVSAVIDKIVNNYVLNVNILKHKSYADSLKKDVPVYDICNKINNNELFKAEMSLSFHETELKGSSFIEVCANICNELAGARLNVWLTCYMETFSGNIISSVYYVDEFYHAFQKDKGLKKHDIPKMPDKDEKSINCLTPWQAERLCCLIYLDSILNHADKGCLYDILSFLLVFGYDDSLICERLPNDLSKEEWDNIILNTLSDSYLSRLKIADYVDINETKERRTEVYYGHKAICFIDDDKNAVVIFRGTYGDDEWRDDAEGMLVSDTKQQIAAAEFIKRLRDNEELKIKEIVTAGHSKGGNNAQYVMIVLPDGYVSRCISINGQGFSNDFIKKYKKQIEDRKEKIELLAERRDFVNCLGIRLTKTYYYAGRRGEHTKRYPYGQPIAYYHYPDALRMNDGQEGNEADSSIIADIVSIFVTTFLSDERYEKIRMETVVNIISLMMTKKTVSYTEIAESIKNLVLLFFELSVENDKFDEMLPMLFIKEADVLLATIGTILSDEEKDNEDKEAETLSRLIRNKLAFSIITNSTNLDYFQKFIKKAIRFLKEVTHEIKYNLDLIDYLYKFFDSIFLYMKESSSKAYRLLASKLEESFMKLRLNIYEKTHEELLLIGINQSLSLASKEFNSEDLIRYINFSINVYKESNPLADELLNRKIFIVNKAVQLIDTIYSNATNDYIVKKGELKSIKEYLGLIKQCLKLDLFLCGFLEEEIIFIEGNAVLDNNLCNISSEIPPAVSISEEICTTNYQVMPKYMNNHECSKIYIDVLNLIINHIERLTNKGLFIYDIHSKNADISEINIVRDEIDKYFDEYNPVKLSYQTKVNELLEYENIREAKEYWKNNQYQLSEKIHMKVLGLHLMQVNRCEAIEYEAKLKNKYDDYIKCMSGLWMVIRKNTKKRMMFEEEIKRLNKKIYNCGLYIMRIDTDIERLCRIIEELKGYEEYSR